MENLQRIALLIDADNTQLAKLEDVIQEISTHGRIVVKRAYEMCIRDRCTTERVAWLKGSVCQRRWTERCFGSCFGSFNDGCAGF